MDPLHDLTLGDVVREHGRSRPLQTALVCGEYRGTYPELNAADGPAGQRLPRRRAR